MKNLFFLFFFLSAVATGYSQNDPEADAAIGTIKDMFDAMRAGDSTALRKCFHPSVRLQTTLTDKEGKARLITGDIEQFITAVGTPHDEVWDEQIWSYEAKIDDNLATVWTEYTFFLGERLSHCGVNAFHLFRTAAGWKITNITDTRRFSNCEQEPLDAINSLLDNWHKAAAVADEKIYFSSMTEDAIFLGTDESEHWTRSEMETLMKEVFERDSAWDFKVDRREVYFDEGGQLAWFDEDLSTWMGDCRGSGVVQKTDQGWKIAHYNLALTIPNDKIDGVMKITGAPGRPKKEKE
ncbi:MAG: nuclear transport factor 2 family protein [Bacteroidota bacterium]